MKTALSTAPGRSGQPAHPPPTPQLAAPRQARRVSLVDRAALRLGLALITWGRRPLELESRERRARYAEQYLARLERERLARRWQGLNLPPR
ncbi:hypothetical protein [Lacisediminihabitans sp. H27-G8]|uniref:hypothetical protein n=1 Tax=Lacisediminihabitans sp. H27-G8 TaxID=3111909 RepID=UPI0038FD3E41